MCTQSSSGKILYIYFLYLYVTHIKPKTCPNWLKKNIIVKLLMNLRRLKLFAVNVKLCAFAKKNVKIMKKLHKLFNWPKKTAE